MLDLIELDAELSNLLRPRAIGVDNLFGVLPLTLRARNLVAGRVLIAFQPFELRDQPPATVLEYCEGLELAIGVDAAFREPGLHVFLVIAHKSRIKHGGILID